jgi:polysaccharide biosynthesis protein PslG
VHGIHNLQPDGSIPSPLRLWDSGVTWRDLNPKPGVYEFDRLDEYLKTTNRPLLVLGATPQWAARNPNQEHYAKWIGPGSNSAPKDSQVWLDFVRRVSSRYKGRLDYQIWNEPQLAEFWYPYTSVRTLAEMTRVAYRAIKFNDLRARVVAAPVLPRTSSGGMKRAGVYLAALRWQKWPVDVYSCHLYPEPKKGAPRAGQMIKQVRTGLKDIGAPTKPLWVTEINYNLMHGNLPDWAVEPLMLATDKAMKDNNVRRCYWYAANHGNPEIFGIPFTPGSMGLQTLKFLS